MTEKVPGPAGSYLFGNASSLDVKDPVGSLVRLAETYGPIYKLTLGGQEKFFVSSYELMNEICDEKRFTKLVTGPLNQVRNSVGDGLFTAHFGEHNWDVAHRALTPAFGPLSIKGMFDEMHDIASQLVVKWARFGPNQKIHVTDDFTRLALDTIGLCAMGTRFNSFYHEEMHPFIKAMTGMLIESGQRAYRPAFVNGLMRATTAKYEEDIALLNSTAAEVIAERRAHPTKKNDLLNALLFGKDPKTGEGLTEQSIMNNMITFLIAGHETTSGLFSFLFYYLLKNPSTYQAAQRQVDEVVGKGKVGIEHASKLPYIEACIRETMRLSPSAPSLAFQVRPDAPDEPVFIGGGKYKIEKGQAVVAVLLKSMRDPEVYGPDPDAFRPERMSDENFAKLPPNAWKPFGNGFRGCIGRPFAWQEVVLAMAMLLQNFDFSFDDPGYTLQVQQSLTIKPANFYMRAKLREGVDVLSLEKKLLVSENEVKSQPKVSKTPLTSRQPKLPMTILYGSNSGTCEALAQSLARGAASRGYYAKVDSLDTAVNNLAKDQPVILISASYEGQPPDNAAHFVEWLSTLKDSKRLEGVKYAVFGVGNHEWVSTYMRIPKLLDSEFGGHGAAKLTDIGFGDVAAGDIFNDFDKWQDENLWATLGGDSDSFEEPSLIVEVDSDSRRSKLRQDMFQAIVTSNEILTAEGEPQKRHIELMLPTPMHYKVGDYMAVLPMNNAAVIRRVLKHYGLPWDAMLTINGEGNTTLPTGHPISAMDILSAYVELSQPATRKNVARIAASAPDEATKAKLLSLASAEFEKEINQKRCSPLDILEEHPTAELPFGDFLAMLPPMRIRQYSISSSPLADPTIATLTWSVLDTPSKANDSTRFLGVASNYLSSVEKGDRIHVAVKPSHSNFHPPNDIEKTPVIMLCAGTGMAPFRGFIQERAIQIKGGRKLAPAYLFVGCSHPEQDRLFGAELAEWEKIGAVEVFYAYSKAKEQSKGCRHVQDRLWEEREAMTKAFDSGAEMYVCGSSMVGEGIASTTKRIFQDYCDTIGKPKTDDEVESWFQGIKTSRYSSDVFA